MGLKINLSFVLRISTLKYLLRIITYINIFSIRIVKKNIIKEIILNTMIPRLTKIIRSRTVLYSYNSVLCTYIPKCTYILGFGILQNLLLPSSKYLQSLSQYFMLPSVDKSTKFRQSGRKYHRADNRSLNKNVYFSMKKITR